MRPEWITAIATFLYAIFTGLIIWQMHKDRRSLHKPILVARLKDASYPDWIIFTVKNIGKGPALECTVLCEGNAGTKWRLEDALPPIGINESHKMRFVEPQYQNDPLSERTITVEIRCLDIFKKTCRHKMCLEMKAVLHHHLRH